jgi:hypothetical protein
MNKWQRPLLQEHEADVRMKRWEVLLYWALFFAVVVAGLYFE